jgi:hypothetical protein
MPVDRDAGRFRRLHGAGKIGDEDYATLSAKLTARAVELMKSLDALAAGRR